MNSPSQIIIVMVTIDLNFNMSQGYGSFYW